MCDYNPNYQLDEEDVKNTKSDFFKFVPSSSLFENSAPNILKYEFI